MSKDPRPDPSPRSRAVSDGEARITRAFRRSLIVLAVIATLVAALVFVPRWLAPVERQVAETRVEAPRQQERPAQVQVPEVRFTDITQAAGIDFVHVNGAYGDKLLPETMGGGVAFLDYDNDGDQDLLFVNSDYWPGHRPPDAPTPTMGLYRNDGHGGFTRVTPGSGLDKAFYGMGVAVGDMDNDGDEDVFITAVGRNHLFRNDQGHFVELTDQAGVGGAADAWSTSAAFLDYDNDGDLDLVIVNNEAAPILYRNDGGNTSDYLRIHTEGTLSNRDGIGAFITITPDLTQPDRQIVWEIDGGSSFLSQNEHTAHFGLGLNAGTIDRVTIVWPSGMVQELSNVAVNQLLHVIEPIVHGDVTGDGYVGLEDLNIILAGWNQQVAAADPVYGDITGDGYVGLEDLNRVLGNWNLGTPPTVTVPEPASAGLVEWCVCVLVNRRR